MTSRLKNVVINLFQFWDLLKNETRWYKSFYTQREILTLVMQCSLFMKLANKGGKMTNYRVSMTCTIFCLMMREGTWKNVIKIVLYNEINNKST